MLAVFECIAAIINFLVNFLLLLAAGRYCGTPVKKRKVLLSAALGAVHAWCCLQSEMDFLGNSFWRIVSLVLMSLIAFVIISFIGGLTWTKSSALISLISIPHFMFPEIVSQLCEMSITPHPNHVK